MAEHHGGQTLALSIVSGLNERASTTAQLPYDSPSGGGCAGFESCLGTTIDAFDLRHLNGCWRRRRQIPGGRKRPWGLLVGAAPAQYLGQCDRAGPGSAWMACPASGTDRSNRVSRGRAYLAVHALLLDVKVGERRLVVGGPDRVLAELLGIGLRHDGIFQAHRSGQASSDVTCPCSRSLTCGNG